MAFSAAISGLREVVLRHVGSGHEVLAVELDGVQAGGLGQVDRLAAGRAGRRGGRPRTAAGRPGRPARAAARRGRGRSGRCEGPTSATRSLACATARSAARRARWRAAALRSDVIRGSLPSSGHGGQHGQRLVGGPDVALVDGQQRPVHQHGGRRRPGRRQEADRPPHRAGPAPASSRPRPWASRICSTSSASPAAEASSRACAGLALLEEPLRGDPLERGHLAGVAALQGRREVGAQQRVVPEPGAAAVERHDEGVALGQVVEHGGRVVATGEPGGEVDGEVLDHAGAQQEVDDVVGQADQHLAGQVVGDGAVGAAELGDERGRVAPCSSDSAASRIPAGQPSVRVCSAARESASSTMSCRSQKSSASSSVKASCAARTSCSRPVSRSRCRPIGGSKRQPRATRTRPSAHSTRCWMPSSTSRVAHLVHVVEDEDQPGHLVAEHADQVRDERRVGRAGRGVEPGEHGRGVGRGLGGGQRSPRSRRRSPSSSRSQVTQATGHPGGALLLGPVGEHRRLAVAGGRAGEQHHGPGSGRVRAAHGVVERGSGEVAEQSRPLHGSVDATGDRHLGARHGERGAQVCHMHEPSQPGGRAAAPVRRRPRRGGRSARRSAGAQMPVTASIRPSVTAAASAAWSCSVRSA